jgi:hypothetical protein
MLDVFRFKSVKRDNGNEVSRAEAALAHWIVIDDEADVPPDVKVM